jgi:hypothetical protein
VIHDTRYICYAASHCTTSLHEIISSTIQTTNPFTHAQCPIHLPWDTPITVMLQLVSERMAEGRRAGGREARRARGEKGESTHCRIRYCTALSALSDCDFDPSLARSPPPPLSLSLSLMLCCTRRCPNGFYRASTVASSSSPLCSSSTVPPCGRVNG